MSPQVLQQQVQDVQAATDTFKPARVLPVNIDYSEADPYELAQEVVYDNGIVKVTMEKGFRWDGASIPVWLPVVPWILSVLLFLWLETAWVLAVTVAIALYVLRLLPYMQKMGKHARGAAVHDKLYRAQAVARVVADAVFESIMESDGVPWDVRWLIHGKVRQFGWYAWRNNKRALAAKAAAARSVEVSQ